MRMREALIMFAVVGFVVGLTPFAKAQAEVVYRSTEVQVVRAPLDSAELALDAREYERSHLLAEQTLADARLAQAQAQAESARQEARDLYLSETLRDEAARLSVLY